MTRRTNTPVAVLMGLALLGLTGCSLFLGGPDLTVNDAGMLVPVGLDAGVERGPQPDEDAQQPLDGGNNPPDSDGGPHNTEHLDDGRCKPDGGGCTDGGPSTLL